MKKLLLLFTLILLAGAVRPPSNTPPGGCTWPPDTNAPCTCGLPCWK